MADLNDAGLRAAAFAVQKRIDTSIEGDCYSLARAAITVYLAALPPAQTPSEPVKCSRCGIGNAEVWRDDELCHVCEREDLRAEIDGQFAEIARLRRIVAYAARKAGQPHELPKLQKALNREMKRIASPYAAPVPAPQPPSAEAVNWLRNEATDGAHFCDKWSPRDVPKYAAEILRFVEGRDNG